MTARLGHLGPTYCKGGGWQEEGPDDRGGEKRQMLPLQNNCLSLLISFDFDCPAGGNEQLVKKKVKEPIMCAWVLCVNPFRLQR